MIFLSNSLLFGPPGRRAATLSEQVLGAMNGFVVSRGSTEFFARLLITEETRLVKISEQRQQTQFLVLFEVSHGDVRRQTKLCFPDFVLGWFKQRTGSWLLDNEELLKEVFADMFSRTGPGLLEIVVCQKDLESFLGYSKTD